MERKKLPIIVGGTNQFIEALMWETPLFNDGEEVACSKPQLDLSTELYSQLSAIDPERAKKLHPNDERKIKRALEVCTPIS